MAELFKFDELRLKTEVQLIQLIHSELDRGIRCARQALSSTHTRAVAEQWNLRANRAHAEASRLIPLALGTPEDELSRLETKLAQLETTLQTLRSAQDENAVLASVN